MSDIKKPGEGKITTQKHKTKIPDRKPKVSVHDSMPMGLIARRPPIETKGQSGKASIKKK